MNVYTDIAALVLLIVGVYKIDTIHSFFFPSDFYESRAKRIQEQSKRRP